MKTGAFMDIIDVHYNKIKTLFKSRAYNNGNNFDEDSFMDAFIKCAQRFGNEIIEYDLAVKYFWVTYVHTSKSSQLKQNKFDAFDEVLHDCIDEDSSYADYIYNIVMSAITEAFGEEDMMIYSLYKYHNWSKEELTDAGYDCTDIDTRIKTIHKFVKSYCKKYRK